MAKVKILVCCGSSMITSSVATNKLKEFFKKNNIDAAFTQCKFSEVPSMIKTFKPDVIVPTGMLDKKLAGDIPVVRGTSFITGIGEKETFDEILNILKNKNLI